MLLAVDEDRRFDGPVFFGNEGSDGLGAVDDHAKRGRLDASGRLDVDVALQKRGHLEADDAVFHAAGLLGGDEVHVDDARVLHGGEDRGLGDFVELEALGRLDGQVQDLGEMPGDGFPFAVRVGREIDFIGLGRFGA